MNETVLLFVLYPLVAGVPLAWLRRRPSRTVWWLAAPVFALASVALRLSAHSAHLDGGELPLVLLFGLVPTLVVFSGLRLNIFRSHPALVPVGTLALFWCGIVVAINLSLALGFGL